jgi:hypothetical protein
VNDSWALHRAPRDERYILNGGHLPRATSQDLRRRTKGARDVRSCKARPRHGDLRGAREVRGDALPPHPQELPPNVLSTTQPRQAGLPRSRAAQLCGAVG